MIIKESQIRKIIVEELLFEANKIKLMEDYNRVLSEGLFDSASSALGKLVASLKKKGKKVDESQFHWNDIETAIGTLFTTKKVGWGHVEDVIRDMSMKEFSVPSATALLNALRKLVAVVNPNVAKNPGTKAAAITKDLIKSESDMGKARSILKIFSDYSTKLAANPSKVKDSFEEATEQLASLVSKYDWADEPYR
jgi:hypothetical protein